jgi:hypothetical protein
MEDGSFYGRQFGQVLDPNIQEHIKKETLIEITELNNFKLEENYIILNQLNKFKIAKLTKIDILPELEPSKKKKFPKVAQYTFNDGTKDFVLNKHFNGKLDDWKDMGGELFTKYRIFHLIEQEDKVGLKKEVENLEKEVEKLLKEVEKLLKSKSIFDSNLTIVNEERPNIKINLKEKYLKYKAKYLQLKNQLNFKLF